MKRRKRKWQIVLGCVAVLWTTCSIVPPIRFKHQINKTFADADAVVIDFNVAPPNTPLAQELKTMPAVRIQGNDKVKEFLSLIDFKYQILPLYGHCMCIGEQAFRFEQSGGEIGALTFHHHQNLRWRTLDTNVPNYDLTNASIARIDAWLEKTSGNALREAEARSSSVWQKIREERDATQPSASEPSQSSSG